MPSRRPEEESVLHHVIIAHPLEIRDSSIRKLPEETSCGHPHLDVS